MAARFLHTPDAVADAVHDGRTRLSLTQKQLAERAGVGRKFVLELEAGHPRAELDKVLAVLKALDISPVVHDAVSAPVSRRIYQLRPEWRPRYRPDVYVPADLRLLAGPTHGSFDPPVHLYWQPGELDFAEASALRRFYSSALTSASTADDYEQWIERESLARQWASLAIPTHVRAAWETIHPTLRGASMPANDRILIQDAILTVVGEFGFALAGGSALIDYAVITRESEDIDTFNDRMDVGLFDAAYAAIIAACFDHGWSAMTTVNESFRRQIRVDAGTGTPVKVDVVYYAGSGTCPEQRARGGLRLVFEDVVGGKGAAISDAPRGRDFDDLAHIIDTPGWSLARVEEAMRGIRRSDQVEGFRASMARFCRGDFDTLIREEGFDPVFSHRILDASG